MVRDLTDQERALCGKNKDAALELKQKGNHCFINADYTTALTCYSQVSLSIFLFLCLYLFCGLSSVNLDDLCSTCWNYKGKF